MTTWGEKLARRTEFSRQVNRAALLSFVILFGGGYIATSGLESIKADDAYVAFFGITAGVGLAAAVGLGLFSILVHHPLRIVPARTRAEEEGSIPPDPGPFPNNI